MKDKYELAKKLEGLPELYQQAWELMTTDESTQERLGLLMVDERVILEKAQGVESLVYHTKQEAEKALPRPDYNSALPTEFVQFLTRWTELNVLRHQIDKIGETLRNLKPSGRYGMRSIATYIGVDILADKLLTKLMKLPDPLSDEYYQLDKRIEARQRTGSIAQRIRIEIGEKYRQQQREAGEKAAEAVLAEHKDILLEERRIKSRIETRRQEKMKPISEQIEALLTKALKG